MIDGTYKIKVRNLLTPAGGTVVLKQDGDDAIIDIDVSVLGKQHAVGKMDGDNGFSAQGSFGMFLLGRIRYKLSGDVDGDSLHTTIKSNRGFFDIVGKRID